MPTVAQQVVELVGDSRKLNSEYDKAKRKSKTWADETRRTVNTAGKALGAAGVAGAAALTAIYSNAVKTGDELAKLSDRIAEAPERLVGLQHAAEITGAGTDKLNSSIERMVKRLGDARDGTGEAAKVLDEMGLSTEKFFSMSPADQFGVIADKVSGLSSQQEKAATAAALFGREGLALVNTLELGSAGLAAMQQEAEDLGLTISRVDLAKMEAANDSFYKAQQVTQGFGRALAAEVAPLVEAIANGFVESAKEAGGFGTIAQKVVTVTAKGLGIMADGIHGIRLLYKGLQVGVAELVNASLQTYAALDRGVTALLNKIPGVSAQYSSFLQNVAESTSNVAEQLRGEFNSFALEPIPSAKIQKWVEETQAAATKAAEEAAANSKKKINIGLDVGADHQNVGRAADEANRLAEENERIVAAQKDKFSRIHEAALEADGKLIDLAAYRRQREIADMQAEIEALRERGLLSAELQSEFDAAKLEQESIYQQRVEEIRTAAREKEIEAEAEKRRQIAEGYSVLLDAVGEYYDGMGGKQAAYARVAISLAQTLLDEDKRAALQGVWANTSEAAMKAYNAMSGIPYIGPALGAAASTAVYAAGGVAAAKITGLAHDGIDAVPETGTWLLEKGERVTTSETSAKLDSVLSRIEANMNGGGGSAARAELSLGLAPGLLLEEFKTSDDAERWIMNVVKRNQD